MRHGWVAYEGLADDGVAPDFGIRTSLFLAFCRLRDEKDGEDKVSKSAKTWGRFLASAIMGAYFIVAAMLWTILAIKGHSYINVNGIGWFHGMGIIAMLQLAYFTSKKAIQCWGIWLLVTVVSIFFATPFFYATTVKEMTLEITVIAIVSAVTFAALQIHDALFIEAPSIAEKRIACKTS